jgi:hypothetical protein
LITIDPVGRQLIPDGLRGAVVSPTLTFAFVKAAVKNESGYFYLVNAVPFVPWSILLALAVWGSFAHRKTYSKPLAIAVTATLLGEILYLGLRNSAARTGPPV